MAGMRIAVLDDYQGVALDLADWSELEAEGAEITVFDDTIGGDALIERLQPFEVVCLMRERTPFPAAVIGALPKLRLIVTTGARNLSIDTAAARARGITVSGTASRGPTTSQFTMALILAATRRILPEGNAMAEGGWQRGLGRDLDGLTLGLIGLGRLGAQVAALARPFGVNLIAWSENLTDERCGEVGGVRRMESLAALMAEADIASIHLLLSDRTRGLIGADALARMKPDALLVNTSRGPIVDWRALLDALHAGRPGMAAVDVYDGEPLPADHPLRDRALIDAGRLLLTPHTGYVSEQTYRTFYRETVEAIEAWHAGRPIREL
ncbi:MAG: D-2-hydroxyacid dehydrogenase family protein [Pseudomonadota bacterium]